MADHPTGAPAVSVVLTTYRRPHLVGRAAESVLRQTWTDLELVIVDDASGDATLSVLEAVAGRDPRVRVLTHSENRGLSAARNTGINAARGRLIGFQDDDDEWRADKLERQEALLAVRPDIDVVTCLEEWRRGDGTSVIRDVRLDGDVRDRLRREDLVHMQTLLVRRRCLDDVGGFDERLFHHEDMDMALRLAARSRWATVAEPLHIFHVTPGSLSTDVARRLDALRTILGSHPELTSDRRIHSLWRYRIGRYEAERGQRATWRRELVGALRLWPFNVRALAGLLLGPEANVRLARVKNRAARLAHR